MTQQINGGVLLESVQSWCDKDGVHPVYDGVPYLKKDETVSYSEIEFIEFTEMMSDKDAFLYRVVLNEYLPDGNELKAMFGKTAS